ncbi:MAG: sn-glycerol-3-phosphate ABC transporter ATP-binding protein UgpC [Lentisphaeria bacterium]|nr:sn-glycerol-3-phosphate ABC transporter ATP-binding protein UgpC [Lentisphaeria bacterium]NQZ71189.1 sn-glycerol-3-phosphate ABC transporter ATP-binding protein UgpC [Lentisphaeria bacterium]
MAGVTLKKVKKVYDGNIVAVHESDLDIQDKEFMVLVGPSGCGKSTTLRMIAGLEEISSGTISIGDRVVNDVPPKDRDIAMVFQNYALYPHMTVYDNMAFGLKLRKYKKEEIKKRVEETAESLGLTDYLQRKPKALSGGQRQRVALGRAIVRNPQVFLLDEPLSNLDAKMRITMRKELNQLHQRLQATMVYVTHDQIEAMTLGQRICVMSDGLIQQVGKPLDVYDNPKNRFVAEFIGNPAMNILDLTFEADSLTGNGINLKLDDRLAKIAQDNGAKKLAFGVRPESFKIEKGEIDGALQGVVEIIEKLGDSQLIYIKVGDSTIVTKIDSHISLEDGEKVSAIPHFDRCHLFTEDGKNISLPD